MSSSRKNDGDCPSIRPNRGPNGRATKKRRTTNRQLCVDPLDRGPMMGFGPAVEGGAGGFGPSVRAVDGEAGGGLCVDPLDGGPMMGFGPAVEEQYPSVRAVHGGAGGGIGEARIAANEMCTNRATKKPRTTNRRLCVDPVARRPVMGLSPATEEHYPSFRPVDGGTGGGTTETRIADFELYADLPCMSSGDPGNAEAVSARVGGSTKKPRKSARELCTDLPCSSSARLVCDSSDPSELPEYYVLPPFTTCVHCGAVKFHKESKGFCCANGQVRLKSYAPPAELSLLFTSSCEESTAYLKYVRSYNCNFSMTSFGVHCDKSLFKDYKGIYTFRIQGQVYHFLNNITPSTNNPSHLQLYFFDGYEEINNRLAIGNNLSEGVLIKLVHILHVNPYVKLFRSLGNHEHLKSQTIRLRCDPGLDQRQYNAPTVPQIAAVCVDHDDTTEVSARDIIVHSASGEPIKIQHYFGCYDPLQYPLLFPYGESGWHRGIELITSKQRPGSFCKIDDTVDPMYFFSPQDFIDSELKASQKRTKRTHVSCREYYCYKLQIRPSDCSILLHSGRLLQQFVVDMYVKIETSRLDYFRLNQTALRAELYQGLVDSVILGESRGKKIGRRIVLPRSFIGSPRDLRTRYMDAMCVVQRYGKPDIFLTMTCNPNWPEITEHLTNNDEVQNRPDLVTRVFRAKLETLKQDLLKKKILGPIAAYIYVVEFQKRGLPHVHFLLILQNNHKLRTSNSVDEIVSAELPDCDTQPYLHSLVTKHMMHGPCGNLNPKNVCMKHNNTCKFNFPKKFCDKTMIATKSYPTYRRTNNCQSVKVRGHFLDNRWVVPYNAFLLSKYNCHINVEICSSVESVKYMYKYIYKGHDKVNFSVTEKTNDDIYDEIKLYQSARWISPPEAMWRIYAFALYDMSPTVILLQLHLENAQSVTYKDDDDVNRIINADYYKRTMLTEYFQMNVNCEFARTILYRDFPEYYVWDKQGKNWYRRKIHLHIIGRIVHVSITEGERYYLRKVLNHVRGARSFSDLKNFNGVKASTFREAAFSYGLLNEDTDCHLCMDEACHYQMPSALRQLFGTVLALCDPHDPNKLWNSFKKQMTEDLLSSTNDIQKAELKALRDIDDLLQCYGKTVDQFLLVHTRVASEQNVHISKDILSELHVPICETDIQNEQMLNVEQRCAYEEIMKYTLRKKNAAFFIDGPGGTGKTFLYKTILATVRSKGLIGLATASSGVAAALLPRGRTGHSRFKIPISVTNETTCAISKQSSLAHLCRTATIIIWDEAPMVNKSVLECLDRLLRDLCDCELPFGGKVLVFGGDFRQVLPIVKKGQKEDILNATLINSYLWPYSFKYKLVNNVRAQSDILFSDYLLRIGNGTEICHSCGLIQLPAELVIPYVNEIDSVLLLIDAVFPDLGSYIQNTSIMMNRVILSPKNEDVDFINVLLINRFPREAVTYYSFDEPMDADDLSFNEDFLNSFTPTGVPPHELVLKINCPIILLRNINPSDGLCNGTRLICRRFDRNIIDAEIAVGEYTGKRVFLPRIPFIPSETHDTPFRFKRTQFPIRVCFAMSINKAQGQTLDFLGLYLPNPVFSHGQLYVALSRAKTSASIKILSRPTNNKKEHSLCTKNVVYTEVLKSL